MKKYILEIISKVELIALFDLKLTFKQNVFNNQGLSLENRTY